MAPTPTLPTWFTNVQQPGGELVEEIDQRVLAGDSAGKLCVPYSLSWVGYSYAATLRPFAAYVTTHRERTRIQEVINTLNDQVDNPLAAWERRAVAITVINAWATRQYDRDQPWGIPSAVVDDIKVLVQTRSSPTAKPLQVFESGTLKPGAEQLLAQTEEELLRKCPTPFRPWRALIQYDAVNNFVRNYTRANYQLSTFSSFENGRPVPGWVDSPGYRLVVLQRLEMNEDRTELVKFRGHMMAARCDGGALRFVDPNTGIVRFRNASQFPDWFEVYRRQRYSTAFPDGGFIKIFPRWRP